MKSLKTKEFYAQELAAYNSAREQGETAKAWKHLQRAHILSQNSVVLHSAIHIEMLRYAFAEKNWRELWGQIPRFLLAGIGSLVGLAPKGNPGTSDFGIFRKHPVPEDLARVL